jgi:hypothetical protein
MRVFISCVSNEFRTVREDLRQRLTTHRDEVKVQEDFGVGGGLLIEKLDRYIRHCDAIIHLSGDGLGSLAKPAEVAWVLATYPDLSQRLPMLASLLDPDLCPFSYTQWECYLALYHRIPCQVCFADAGSQRESGWQGTDADRAAQRAHEDRLKSRGQDRLQASFTNADRIALEFLQELRAAQSGPEAPPPLPNHVYRWPEVPDLPPHELADCTAEMALFRALISGQSAAPVLLIRGPSAMGKSKLLQQFAKLARQQTGLRVAVGDFKHGLGLADLLHFARGALRDLPFPAFDAEWSGGRRDETLGRAFLDDLRRCPDPVLLLLDTYEQATAENQRWVETRLLPRCCQHDGLRLVIAGQQVPEAVGVMAPPTERRELLLPRPEDWDDYYHRVLRGKPLPSDHFKTLWLAVDGRPSAMCAMLATVCKAA